MYAKFKSFKNGKRNSREATICPRHTPLSVYLGLMIHSKTRVKGVIIKLEILGLSITYNCVSEIQEPEQVMKQKIKQFDEMGLVCPKNLTKLR